MRRTMLLVSVIALITATFAATAQAQDARPRAALGRVLPDLDFAGATLADAIEFLRDVSGANIHVNWPALEAVGIGRDTPINLRMRNIPLRKVLQLVLREAASDDTLTWYIDEGIIEITTRELADEQMVTRIYPVDDLIMEVPDFIGPDFQLQGSQTGGGAGGGGGIISGPIGGDGDRGMTRAERADQLIDMIQAIIYPDIWDINGGRAAIRFFNGALVVTAPRSVHEALGRPID